jgi:hypothetical protein
MPLHWIGNLYSTGQLSASLMWIAAGIQKKHFPQVNLLAGTGESPV